MMSERLVKVTIIEIGIESLEKELAKLRNAIEEYGTRSLVGDSVLVMENAVRGIKEAVKNLKEDSETVGG